MTTAVNFQGGSTGGLAPFFDFVGHYAASALSIPAGQLDLNGNRPLRIASVEPDRPSGDYAAFVHFAGVNYSAGQTIPNCAGGTGESRIYQTGGAGVGFRRANSGGSTVRRNASNVDQSSWSTGMSGLYRHATVPSQPGPLGVSRSGRDVTLTFAAPSSNGGYSVSSYSGQYSTDGGATWSTPVAVTSGYTFEDLPAGEEYIFGVYANNLVGSSQRRVSAAVFVPAGGRIWDGSAEDLTTVAVYWDGSAEVPIVTAVYWDGSAEVPLA